MAPVLSAQQGAHDATPEHACSDVVLNSQSDLGCLSSPERVGSDGIPYTKNTDLEPSEYARMEMATPISKNRHIEACTMKHDGQELTVEVVFEVLTEKPEAGRASSYRLPKATQLTITHQDADGRRQEMCLDGSSMAQLRILLGRITSGRHQLPSDPDDDLLRPLGRGPHL